MQKDRGRAEGKGECCVYLHELQKMHCHPKLGFGGGKGSISRFPMSQDPPDPFLCGPAALHMNSGAEPYACTGWLLGRAAVLERKQSCTEP